jgi:hypothetical protein
MTIEFPPEKKDLILALLDQPVPALVLVGWR